MNNDVVSNPLYYEKPYKLLFKYATPSIISMLVGSLYNIVDQIFIGQGVGINLPDGITVCLVRRQRKQESERRSCEREIDQFVDVEVIITGKENRRGGVFSQFLQNGD